MKVSRPSASRFSNLALALALTVVTTFSWPAPWVLAQQEEQRTTIDIDGTAVHLPAADADLAEELKSSIIAFNTIRKYGVAAETRAILATYQSDDLRENQWQLITTLFGGRYPRDRFDKRYDERCVDLKKVAELWQHWSRGIGDLYFWNEDDLEPFAAGENAFRFPQIHFSNSGRNFNIHPPITSAGYGINAFDLDNTEPQSFRLDLPLVYKPGTPVDELLSYPRSLLRKIPDLLREMAGGPLASRTTPWFIEDLALDELRSSVFAESARDGILPLAVARYMTALPNISSEDAAKKKALTDTFAHTPGSTPEAVEVLLAGLEKIDPLDPPFDDSEEAEDLRFICRNLITLALLDTTIGGKDNTLFQRFEKAGIPTPEGGFEHDTFVAAVDQVMDEDEAGFARKIDELLQARIKLIRTQLDAIKVTNNKTESNTVPVSAEPAPGRTASTFGEYEISHPESLTKVVAEVGPEIVKNIAIARQQALDAKAPKDLPTVEVSEEDSQALARYGLSPDLDTLQKWALGSASFMDLQTPLMLVLNSTHIQIWLKKELADYYDSGGRVEGFSLDPKTGKFTYNFKLNSNFKLKDIESTKQVSEGFKSDIDFVWPIILDLEPKAVTADKIREEASEFFDKQSEEEKTSPLDLNDLRLLSPEGVFFFAVHETVELQLVHNVIGSNDRRWFCDGLANWIAIQECDRRYGDGKGIEVFETMFRPKNYEPIAGEVDLFAWPALENQPPDFKHEHAHYYFATRVLLAACKDQDDDFVKNWLTEIRLTPWNRTNTSHILAAYQTLTGKDLREIVEVVTKK